VVLPVIHVLSSAQADTNIQIAIAAGALGVFLINHDFSWKDLIPIVRDMKKKYPNLWIGVNFLGLPSAKMFQIIKENDLNVQGVWSDNAEIDESKPVDVQPLATKIQIAKQSYGFEGLYFGGTCFKYQRQVNDIKTAASIASHFMDVITTSGPGTGHAADTEKIRLMREGCQGHPLAIASGVTPENVKDFLSFVDVIIVATGISSDFNHLNLNKAKKLIYLVQNPQAR